MISPSKQIVNNETGKTRLDSYLNVLTLFVSGLFVIVVLNVVIYALVH